MRIVRHPNIVELKAFYYSNGDRVSRFLRHFSHCGRVLCVSGEVGEWKVGESVVVDDIDDIDDIEPLC